MEGVIWRKVRQVVESEGTEANSSSLDRRCSMSPQHSPPPASMSMSMECTNTLPRSWRGRPFTGDGDASGQRSPETEAVAKGPKSVQLDMGHDLLPAAFHDHVSLLVASPRKCPPVSGPAALRQAAVSQLRRAFSRNLSSQQVGSRE